MANALSPYADVTSFIARRAQEDANIRASFVFGSRGHLCSRADNNSDLDIALICDNTSPFFANYGWVKAIGSPLMTYAQPVSAGIGRQVRVLFPDMRDVDFTFFTKDDLSNILKNQMFFNGVLGRGIQILCDKDSILPDRTQLEFNKHYALPVRNQEAFTELTYDFLFHAVSAAKKIERGELLTAKNTLDVNMRGVLLQAIRWQQLTHNPEIDVWHRARFFEEWADRGVLSSFKETCPAYDKQDLREKIEGNLSLYRKISDDICERDGLQFPEKEFLITQQWVRNHGLR